jgi:hypothetical protein
MCNSSLKQANIITGWLIEVLGGEQFYCDVTEMDDGYWFQAEGLFKHLNGNRNGCNDPENHRLYSLSQDEYCVFDIERHPRIYVNGMGAMKMLHNIISPVTEKIFKKVGLDRIKQIVDSGRLIIV